MTSSRSQFKFPQVGLTILIAFVLLAETLAGALYSMLDVQPSPLFQPLFAITFASALMLWVHHDSRSTKISMGLDQAPYLFMAWPITFPVYVFRSYGFRSGSLILLSFIGIYALTLISAIFLIFAVSAGRVILSAG
jgi:hypothetical protein